MPNFLSSPRMRRYPHPVASAISRMRLRISSGFRGRPRVRGVAFILPSLIQRANVRGWTMVISSLIANPSRTPSLASFARSAGVTLTRLGSLLLRIRFSAFRYSM